MVHSRTAQDKVADTLHRLHERRRQLLEWVQVEETSREGAQQWKAEVLKGRLQEVEWAIELLEP